MKINNDELFFANYFKKILCRVKINNGKLFFANYFKKIPCRLKINIAAPKVSCCLYSILKVVWCQCSVIISKSTKLLWRYSIVNEILSVKLCDGRQNQTNCNDCQGMVWNGMEEDFSIFHTGNFLPFHFHSIPKILHSIFHSILKFSSIFHSILKFSSIFHSILPYQRNFRLEAMRRMFCCFAPLQCCKQPLVKVRQQY